MKKIWLVAATEFVAAVKTKAFLIAVVVIPLLMGGSVAFQRAAEQRVDTEDRSFAVIDHTGTVYPELERAAIARNESLRAAAADGPRKPAFLPRAVSTSARPLDEVRLALSAQIRRKELFAFVEIPAAVLAAEDPSDAPVVYHTDNPGHSALHRWLSDSVNRIARARRLSAAGIDPAQVSRLSRRVETEVRGLLMAGPDGAAREAPKVDKVRSFAVPLILMILLFTVVMTTTPALLNSVLEEKMSRISEVLLGSVSPTQLMMGKLVGSIGVSILLSAIYVGGGLFVAARLGFADPVPPAILAWFVVFLLLALFLYGSIFLAIGSACNELKDAQNLMTPAMLLVMMPLFAATTIAKAPDSALAAALSLFPPATPMLMLLRLTVQPAPPLWQVALGVLLTAATAVLFVWAAGKIFRVGLLMRGKSASFRDMLRWVAAD